MVWLDHELPEAEAAEMVRHVGSCAECRSGVTAYREASNLFDEYCEAVVASKAHRRTIPAWMPLVAGAAVTATVGALLLAFVPARVEQLPAYSQVASSPSALVLKAGPLSPVKKNEPQSKLKQERRAVQHPERGPVRNEEENWVASRQAIQITIPGDAMFPPGAVPDGVNFVADLSIAADGSPEEIRLRP
jgi:hypothetical protein